MRTIAGAAGESSGKTGCGCGGVLGFTFVGYYFLVFLRSVGDSGVGNTGDFSWSRFDYGAAGVCGRSSCMPGWGVEWYYFEVFDYFRRMTGAG